MTLFCAVEIVILRRLVHNLGLETFTENKGSSYMSSVYSYTVSVLLLLAAFDAPRCRCVKGQFFSWSLSGRQKGVYSQYHINTKFKKMLSISEK